MQGIMGLKRQARALMAALLILAAATLVVPSAASAHGGAYGRYRVARHSYARTYCRPRTRYRSSYAYRSYYRPYYVSYYRPRYRAVVIDDPYSYCDDDYGYVVRPVYRSYHHRRPRVAVSLSFGSPGYYVGDPYCGW